MRKVVVTDADGISIFNFDGSVFDLENVVAAGPCPSWVMLDSSSFPVSGQALLRCIDEADGTARELAYNANDMSLKLISEHFLGIGGIVHLNSSRHGGVVVGANFNLGALHIWDNVQVPWSAADHVVRRLNHVPLNGQPTSQAHQAVFDPTERFIVVPQRGADTLSVIDANAELGSNGYRVVNMVPVLPSRCGPRHGAFLKLSSPKGREATHFVLVCEMQNLLQLFAIKYRHTTLEFNHIQTISTFGPQDHTPNATVPSAETAGAETAAAGACVVDSTQRFIYASNRLTGNAEDSISVFEVHHDGEDPSLVSIVHMQSISSFGVSPRMISLSRDETLLYSTNMRSGASLMAYSRHEDGRLEAIKESVLTDMNGAMFVQEI